jgi:hypothetical protein
MRINYKTNPPTYYDMNGEELHDGDVVLMDRRKWLVMQTADDYLGVDSTNPRWIENGRAVPGEYGIYPFNLADEPIKLAVDG